MKYLNPLTFEEAITAPLDQINTRWLKKARAIYSASPNFNATDGTIHQKYSVTFNVVPDSEFHKFLMQGYTLLFPSFAWDSNPNGNTQHSEFLDGLHIFATISDVIKPLLTGSIDEKKILVNTSMDIIRSFLDNRITTEEDAELKQVISFIKDRGLEYLKYCYYKELTIVALTPDKPQLHFAINQDQFIVCCAIGIESGIIGASYTEMADFAANYFTVEKQRTGKSQISNLDFNKKISAVLKGEYRSKALDRIISKLNSGIQRLGSDKK